MHQNLTLPTPLIIIRHDQVSRQAIRVKRDAVNRIKRIWPLLSSILAQARRAQSEIQLDRHVGGGSSHGSGGAGGRRGEGGGCRSGSGFRGGLAEEFPAGRAGEAVLREGLGLGVVGGCAEDLFTIACQSRFLYFFPCSC